MFLFLAQVLIDFFQKIEAEGDVKQILVASGQGMFVLRDAAFIRGEPCLVSQAQPGAELGGQVRQHVGKRTVGVFLSVLIPGFFTNAVGLFKAQAC